MDLFSRDDLRLLLMNRQTPCVSLFMPTTRGVGHEDKKRWKHLIWEAGERLTAAGSRTNEAKDLLRPAQELLDDTPFWLNVSDGLAAFLSPEIVRFYRLPMTFNDQVVVADRFQVKSLVPLLSSDGPFYVLALSRKSVRLLRGTRQSVDEVALQGVPTSFDEALQSDWVDETRTFHTHPAAGGRADARETIFHGQGEGIDSAKEGLLEFCQRVARGLRRLLPNEPAPLVLAGVNYLLAIYRQANTYPHLQAEGVEGNPDRLSAQELHDRAWPVVEPYFREPRDKTAALYRQLAGTGRTASDLAQVVAAAYQGQLQFLFVALGQEQWGSFDPVQQKVEIHERAEPGDEDLLNFAVVHALSHKGTVYAVKPEELPDRTPVAAIFWLPLGER